jgi:hypothetical protein
MQGHSVDSRDSEQGSELRQPDEPRSGFQKGPDEAARGIARNLFIEGLAMGENTTRSSPLRRLSAQIPDLSDPLEPLLALGPDN